MTNNYILIFIKCVTVSRNSNAYYSAWTAELSNYLSGVVKQNEFKVITVGEAPNPTYLVVKSKTKESYSVQSEVNSTLTNDLSLRDRPFEFTFNWQVGLGFTGSYSKFRMKFPEVGDEHKHLHFDFLIEKYLEFLKRFNNAYDDDIYLNMSFYHA
jgi:hypothetical protein